MTESTFDVAIIGGGINGVGTARDCAMRGLSTVLFEKNDLCAGSTGACSGMIHGGPRYLETERETARKSCEDSAIIQKIAPNLLFRVPILIPVTKEDPKIYLEMVETFCKAYDNFSKIKGGKPHVRLSKEDIKKLEPGLSEDVVGGATLDEWGTDPFRLVVLNAKSAREKGVKIYTHCKVEKIEVEKGRAIGVWASGNAFEKKLFKAKVILNLTGPWSPWLDKKIKIPMRPSKGVHLVLDRRVINISVVCKAVDGRESVFILPHEHTTLIGTTDDDFYGSPDKVSITQDEVSYLLQAVAKYFPAIYHYRFMRAFVGIRPTLFNWGVYESSLSRDHKVFDHAEEGYAGLFSMIGGKLAAYRVMCEELTDKVCEFLEKKEPCKTHLETLPGCTHEMPWQEVAKHYKKDPWTVKRLMYRHGETAYKILEMSKDPEFSKTLCECENVIASEVAYCVKEEWAENIYDIRRRTRLGMGPCQSCKCALNVACFMGRLLNWSNEQVQREAQMFLESRWHGNLPVLFGDQLKQEEYTRFAHANYKKN